MTPRKAPKPKHLTIDAEEQLLMLALDTLKATLTDPSSSPQDKAKASNELRQVLVALRRISDLAPADAATDPIEAIKLRAIGGTR